MIWRAGPTTPHRVSLDMPVYEGIEADFTRNNF
jgi:hypothetical protein